MLKKWAWLAGVLMFASMLAFAGPRAGRKQKDAPARFTLVTLQGGRRLEFVRTFSSERDVHPKRSFWNKVLDFVAGQKQWRRIIRPYSIATDSRGRILVTDPGALAVHIFDFQNNKYHCLEGGKGEEFHSPIGVAVDADDNIYVTDSALGKIFVYDAGGKFRRFLGAVKGGEGFFKRPTGIAIDKAQGRIYLSDTLRDRIYVLDLGGNVLHYFGGRGTATGQFNFPTDVLLHGDELLVVDSMNFRVQIFDRSGTFRGQVGTMGNVAGFVYRPKGLGIDSEGDIYLVDASLEAVQVFNRAGELLYSFGRTGTGIGEFELPAGLLVDAQNTVFVADSYNRRVQVFQFTPAKIAGAQP